MAVFAIKVEHINPFVTSTIETFSSMIGVNAEMGKITLAKDNKAIHDISGIIGLSGTVRGTVSLSFPKATAIKVANKFMGADYDQITAETADAIGELANIVAGYAKKGLKEFSVNISLPSVVMGENHQIMEPKGVASFIVPFQSVLGDFSLAVSLKNTEI